MLSGIQPSGSLHLGNWFGMMKRMIEYQDSHELFCFIVNYHALTSNLNGDALRHETLQAACDFLALGLDPKKSVFWVQSDLAEVTELTWILSNVTAMGLLERCHSYKDKIAQGLQPHHGLFSYPVLMAADILIMGGERIPIGQDQKQHVEVARDIAMRFNHRYGETFVLPDVEIEPETAVIPGLDGQKMSKSYNNTIEIFIDDKRELKRKIDAYKTDSTAVEDPKKVQDNNLYLLYSRFLDRKGREELKGRFLKPGLKYSDVKAELVEVIWKYFEAARERRKAWAADRKKILKVLKEGAERARSIARPMLEAVREKVGVAYAL